MSAHKAGKPDFRLRIDAHALVQLGEQLITDDEQALLELVKNSYDADADWAKIRIKGDYVPTKSDFVPAEAVGLIEIEDNGTGMGQRAIENGWLLISLSLKREQKTNLKRTPKHHRLPLGDKGLGRLGTMKLGKCLSVETRNSPTEQGWLVTFQWSDVKSGTPLDQVPITWRRVPANGQTGTTVRIFGLRNLDTWRSDRRKKRLELRLSGLISPFETENEFEVHLDLNGRDIDFTRISAKLRQTATMTFDYDWDGKRLRVGGKLKLTWFRKKREGYDEFIARDEGKALFQELKQNPGLVKEFQPQLSREPSWFLEISREVGGEDLPFSELDAVNPGPFSGALDYFDLDSDIELPAKVFGNASDYRTLVKQLAQIYVYRDGFGIRMPNDWLNLGGAWTSQTGFYSLKPNNVIGFFRISVEGNPELIEKSDREGFTENGAWKGFWLLADNIARAANKCLNRLGKTAAAFLKEATGNYATSEQSAANYGDLVQRLETLITTSESVKNYFDQHAQTRLCALRQVEGSTRVIYLNLKESDENRQKAQQLLAAIERVQQDFASDTSEISRLATGLVEQKQLAAILRRRIDDFEDRLQLMYEMVGVGLSAQALAHDVPPILQQLDDQAKSLGKLGKARPIETTKVVNSIEGIRTSIEAVSQMLDFVQPMLRGRRLSRRKAKLSEFVNTFYELRGARLLTRGIKWHLEPESIRDFEISFNPGRFTQILDNLTTNSEYWLDHHYGRGSKEGKILLEIHEPELIFYDNGLGVRSDLEDSIFEPFTSGKEDGQGNGLGLFITRQLLLRDNCTISLDTARNKHNRRYRFIINFSGVRASAK